MREISPEFLFIGEKKESLKLCLNLIYEKDRGALKWAERDNVLYLYEYASFDKEAILFPVVMTTEMLFPVVSLWLDTKEPENSKYSGDGSNVAGYKIEVIKHNDCVAIRPWNIFYGK